MKRIIGILAAGFVLIGFASLLSAQEEMSADPLGDIVTDMNSAATRLAKLKTDKPTQKSQEDAIKKLDLLIKELEEQSGRLQQQGGMVNPNPKKPAQDSTIRQGPGGMGKLHAENREGKKWGELPPAERKRILQSMNEGFPSHYQKLLENYFARLANEKSAEESDLPEKSASTPADAPDPAKKKTEKDGT